MSVSFIKAITQPDFTTKRQNSRWQIIGRSQIMNIPSIYSPPREKLGIPGIQQHKDIISIYPLPEDSNEMLLLDNGMNLHVIPKSDFPKWQHRVNYNHPSFKLLEDVAFFSTYFMRKRIGLGTTY